MYYGNIKDRAYGFYSENNLLENYVEIENEEADRIVKEANDKGVFVIPDENGYPVLEQPEEPTEEELKQKEIIELENYLTSTDWYAIRYADIGEPIPQEVKEKRANARKRISELRDNSVE